MKITQADIFCPKTARPHSKNSTYVEILPDEKLRPYIRCFWSDEFGDENSANRQKGLIIPDACMDIIIQFDEFNNLEWSCFCTVDERAYFHFENSCSKKTMFGIRFYAWTAGFFATENLNGVSGKALDAEAFFPDVVKNLVHSLCKAQNLTERINLSNQFFLNKLSVLSVNNDLMNLCTDMIHAKSLFNIKDMTRTIQKSERQLERLFKEKIGVPPKTLASIIRYQKVWNDILENPNTNIQDIVFKYNYFDQSHLLKDFKRRHGMSTKEALKYARSEE